MALLKKLQKKRKKKFFLGAENPFFWHKIAVERGKMEKTPEGGSVPLPETRVGRMFSEGRDFRL